MAKLNGKEMVMGEGKRKRRGPQHEGTLKEGKAGSVVWENGSMVLSLQ